MKEFTITVTSDRPKDPSNFLASIGRTPAGPQVVGATPEEKKEEIRISTVTLTARLVDVEYDEAQSLLERMKADAKRA